MKYTLYISIIIYSFILFGNISEEYRFLGSMPHEIIIIIFFFFILFQKSSHIKWGNWLDRSFFLFFLCIVVFPVFFNFHDFIENNNFSKINVIFFYLKMWIYYRVFLYLIFYRVEINAHENINKTLEIFCNASTLAALIGIARFFKVPYVYNFIEYTWPIKAGFLADEWGRLVSTMGGTNTGGVFFAIGSVTALYIVIAKNSKLKLYQVIILVFAVILSGSFTGIIVMMGGLLLLLTSNKMIKFGSFFKLGLISAIMVFVMIKYTPIGEIINTVVDKRSNEQFRRTSIILPVSLIARYNDWIQLIPVTLKNKPLFGYGFQESNMVAAQAVNYNPRKSLAENYYVEVLIVSGIIGLLSFIYFIIKLILKLKRRSNMPHLRALLLIIVYMYLLAQFSQPTIKYGGLNEFFSLIMAIVYVISIAPDINRIRFTQKNNL